MTTNATIEQVRDVLLDQYLGFRYGGLHLETFERAGALKARYGLSIQAPEPTNKIALRIVADQDDQVVGSVSRCVSAQGPGLVVWHEELRLLLEQWRRHGFGSALLGASENWYRAAGVTAIRVRTMGDGSRFAAVRDFDFDLDSYVARSTGLRGLEATEIRLAAVYELVNHPAICEPMPPDTGGYVWRESVREVLERVADLGVAEAEIVREFRSRLPLRVGHEDQPRFTAGEDAFSTPSEVAAFGGTPAIEACVGESLGRAVLARTCWDGIKFLLDHSDRCRDDPALRT